MPAKESMKVTLNLVCVHSTFGLPETLQPLQARLVMEALNQVIQGKISNDVRSAWQDDEDFALSYDLKKVFEDMKTRKVKESPFMEKAKAVYEKAMVDEEAMKKVEKLLKAFNPKDKQTVNSENIALALENQMDALA